MKPFITIAVSRISSILALAIAVIATMAISSCSGSVAEDEIESNIEQIKNVSTQICGDRTLVNVNTTRSTYTTSLDNIKGVNLVDNDTVVVGVNTDIVPVRYYLSTRNQDVQNWRDGNFDHKETIKTFVLCFADGQTASLNFRQENVRFMSTQMPTPEIEETEPTLVNVSEYRATDNDEYVEFTCTYEMQIKYEGMDNAATLSAQVVMLQAKDAINFNGSVNNFDSEHSDTQF